MNLLCENLNAWYANIDFDKIELLIVINFEITTRLNELCYQKFKNQI